MFRQGSSTGPYTAPNKVLCIMLHTCEKSDFDFLISLRIRHMDLSSCEDQLKKLGVWGMVGHTNPVSREDKLKEIWQSAASSAGGCICHIDTIK